MHLLMSCSSKPGGVDLLLMMPDGTAAMRSRSRDDMMNPRGKKEKRKHIRDAVFINKTSVMA